MNHAAQLVELAVGLEADRLEAALTSDVQERLGRESEVGAGRVGLSIAADDLEQLGRQARQAVDRLELRLQRSQ